MSVGGVTLYRVKNVMGRSLTDYPGTLTNWGAKENNLTIDIKNKMFESTGISNQKWFGFRYILNPEVYLQNASAIGFDVYLSLENDTVSRPYRIMFYLEYSNQENSVYIVEIETNKWSNVIVVLDKTIQPVKSFNWAIFTNIENCFVKFKIKNVTIFYQK
jgi:hypothetical protein